MRTKLDIICRIPMFDGLPEDQLKAIEQIAVDTSFKKGECIFSEGDLGDGFYLVLSGTVKIFKLSPEGKEQTLHILGPGEPFGEVPVFSGRAFPANAEAIAESSLLFLPRDAFVTLLTSNPSLSLNMLALLCMRLRQFTVQIENLSLKEVPARLASYILYLAEEQGDESMIILDISKTQLAALLGTIPETLSRIFARISREGLIEIKDRRIKLINLQGLKNLADQGK